MKSHNAIIVIIIICLLLGSVFYNMFIFKPKINHEVFTVKCELNDLKIYMDKKIPELDSATQLNQRHYIELKKLYNDAHINKHKNN